MHRIYVFATMYVVVNRFLQEHQIINKKSAIVAVLTLAIAGVVFAQVAPIPFSPYGYTQTQAQVVKVDGKLALLNGVIALKSGTKTYYVPMLGRLAGFIEGVKEGVSVKLEGFEFPIASAPEYATLAVIKLSVGGKDYDLGQFGGFGTGFNHHGGMMRGGRW